MALQDLLGQIVQLPDQLGDAVGHELKALGSAYRSHSWTGWAGKKTVKGTGSGIIIVEWCRSPACGFSTICMRATGLWPRLGEAGALWLSNDTEW